MSSKTTTIIGIIILIVAIVIIGFVVSKKRAARVDTLGETTTQPAGTGAPVSGGTSTNAIGNDVSGTSFYELDSELETLK